MSTAMQRKAKRIKTETNANRFDKLFNEAIVLLENANISLYVKAIKELAAMYKIAGQSPQTFTELCTTIEDTAFKRINNPIEAMKIKLAVREECQNGR